MMTPNNRLDNLLSTSSHAVATTSSQTVANSVVICGNTTGYISGANVNAFNCLTSIWDGISALFYLGVHEIVVELGETGWCARCHCHRPMPPPVTTAPLPSSLAIAPYHRPATAPFLCTAPCSHGSPPLHNAT